jgi:hypothetical protein
MWRLPEGRHGPARSLHLGANGYVKGCVEPGHLTTTQSGYGCGHPDRTAYACIRIRLGWGRFGLPTMAIEEEF